MNKSHPYHNPDKQRCQYLVIRQTIKIQLENKVLIIKNIYTNESIKIGDSIFIYNLFCPDGNSQILFAMKQTIIKYE